MDESMLYRQCFGVLFFVGEYRQRMSVYLLEDFGCGLDVKLGFLYELKVKGGCRFVSARLFLDAALVLSCCCR